MVVEPVEAPHLVRAVVRAEPRADAAVVDHLVEAVGAVHGRVRPGTRTRTARPRSAGTASADAPWSLPGSSASSVSMRSQCISRLAMHARSCRRPGCCSRPEHATTHALQPVQASRSIVIATAGCPRTARATSSAMTSRGSSDRQRAGSRCGDRADRRRFVWRRCALACPLPAP